MKLSFKNLFKNSKSNPILLAHNDRFDLKPKQTIDVILSPKYYWTKKEKLPVKYAYQAKAYAHSSFEGLIPEGNYTYLVQKNEDDFILYAYDDSFIIKELEKIGINSSQISKVYFAQNEFENFDDPIKLSETEVLLNHDKIVLKLPARMVNKSVNLSEYFKTHSLSKFYITLNKFNNIIDYKKAYTISALLLMLTIFYSIEFIWLNDVQSDLKLKKEQITKKYKMPATSMQADILKRELQKKANSQLLLREKFYNITKIPLTKNQILQSIEYQNSSFEIKIDIKNDTKTDDLQRYLLKYFKLKNVTKTKEQIIFEVKYDKKD